ncbi:hypothetical protein AQUCO_00200703v1 [Aquilegia coerulea]|uniref:Transmembrane protein n=1 Tax=Aquilegia coerulea TaxID=218851 RepID=A0A2G5F4I8_AQUCA|nr:hypothetical protein AQUCO_00200703v1 [Aquilegia coerulea]
MEKREEEISQVLNSWEPFPSQQPSFQPHSSSSSLQQQQVQAQTREWEMVEHRRNEDEDEDDDFDFSIFPPSNHEGLHIPSHHQQQQQHHVADVEQYSSPLPEPQPQPQSNVNQEQPLDSLIDAKKMLMKNLRLGVEVISSNIFRVVSLCHYYARRRMRNWSSSVYVGGFSFTMALLMSFWFFKWQRWRRRESREEKIDQLFQLVRHQDEKMNQLLDQISYLNELLAHRRRISILRSD